MCNFYSLTRSREEILRLFRIADNRGQAAINNLPGLYGCRRRRARTRTFAAMMMAFAKYGPIDVEKLTAFAVQQF
jgi:hypothetical protein